MKHYAPELDRVLRQQIWPHPWKNDLDLCQQCIFDLVFPTTKYEASLPCVNQTVSTFLKLQTDKQKDPPPTPPPKKSPNLWGINVPFKFSLSLFWFDNWCIGTHNKFPPLNTSNTDPFRWGPIILHLLAISIHFGVRFDALKFHKIIFHMQICHYYQPSTCPVFTFSFCETMTPSFVGFVSLWIWVNTNLHDTDGFHDQLDSIGWVSHSLD